MEPVSPITIAICLCFSFFLGAAVTLSAVALGGYLVFRTKKEPHDSLFGKEQEAKAFLVDEFRTEPIPYTRRPVFGEPADQGSGDPVPGMMEKQTEKFLRVLKEKKEQEKGNG